MSPLKVINSDNKIQLKGQLVDAHTRCRHYHTTLDIIAIKFKCCGVYFPCYKCHSELENHDIIRWEKLDLASEKFIRKYGCTAHRFNPPVLVPFLRGLNVSLSSFYKFYLNYIDMTPMSPTPTDHLDGSEKTTIIISNLDKDDFVSDHENMTSKMSFVDRIKLNILNLPKPPNVTFGDEYYLNMIEQWSNLPFLSRIIIIMKNEELAALLHKYLISGSLLPQHVKVSLQENLITKSKSFDSLIGGNHDSLSITNSLANFKQLHNDSTKADSTQNYSEPEPQQFNVYEDLTKIGIHLKDYNDEDQIQELKEGSLASGCLKRTRSLTRTLFKPELKVNTHAANMERSRTSKVLPSPTITLDETF